ncbi:MAG: FG-GAP repeat domain-containing protein, partial [Planctomycetota bacterium]
EGPAQRPLTLVGVRVADGQLKLAQQTSPGTFGSPFARAATSAGVQALLLADFDRDGLVDVAVTDVAANEIVILHRDDSAWNLTEAQRCAVASTPADLVAVDLLRRARLDLVVACSGSADASILFADDATPGQFLAATALATAGSGSASVVAGDIDADGKPDLLFAHPADSLVTVALQARETPGNFDLTLPFVLDAPVALGLADLDRDGRPDLLAATNQPSGRVLLRRNTTPHACRSPLAERVCGQVAAAVVVDDFNADGRPDLLRVTDGVLWLGRGDASLRLSTTLLASYTYSRLIAADLNQDGLPDVIATSSSPWTLRVFLNLSGNPGQFTLAQETSDFPQNLSAIAVGDITNDGVPDLVYGSNSNNVVVYEGAGDGTFIETAWATLDSRIHANSLIVADLNDDDLLDIISYINSDLTILLQNTASPGTFITPAQWRTIPSGGLVVQLADLDNDGLIDIVNSGTGSSNDATWFRQNPASPGNFLATAVLLDRGSRTMLIRDLNDDNLPDLLFADYVALNEGGASFTDNGLSKKSGLTITFADVNGDGRDDVVYDSGALIALDSGLPPFSDRGIAAVSSYSNPTFPIVADLDRDGRPDIVSRLGDDDIGTTLQDPAGGFPVRVLTQLGNTTFAPHFAVGDVNGDGVPDLVLPRIGVSILPGDGAGNFPSNVTYAATLSTAVALADVNRDGHLDVLVSTTDDKLHVKFNIGNGTFAASVESAALDADLIAAGDMNGDGIPDAVTAHSSNKTVEVLLLADDGTVASQASTAIGGYIYAIELADLDRDGLLDLVISSDNTLVMFNDPASPGTLLAPVAIATSIGGSMALADMDRDGWLDVVLHSPSQPAAVVTLLLHQSDGSYRRETRDWLGGNTPINLAIGDIDRDGLPDAVCGTEGDMLVIPGSMDGRR